MDNPQLQAGTVQPQHQQSAEHGSGEGSDTALLRLKEQEQLRADGRPNSGDCWIEGPQLLDL